MEKSAPASKRAGALVFVKHGFLRMWNGLLLSGTCRGIRKTSPWGAVHQVVLAMSLLVLAAVVIYRFVWQFEFINFDDQIYITDNSVVLEGISGYGIAHAFRSFVGGNWHPLTMISHMLDCELFGRWAGGHHLTSALLHVLNSVLLFLVLRFATKATWRSLLVGLLFAVHPLNVESVVWISQRKTVLSMFFMLASLGCYAIFIKKKGGWWYGVSFGCFGLALMSKPIAVSLPFLLFLFDYWPLGRELVFRKGELTRRILEKVPFLMASVAICVVTYKAQKAADAVVSATVFSLGIRIANSARSYFLYLSKLFLPVNLSAYYPYQGQPGILEFVLFVSVLATITVVAVILHRKTPWIMSGWAWFLISMVPMIGIVQVGGQQMADRYAYLPFIGLFIVLSWSLGEVSGMSSRLRVPTVILSVLAVVALTFQANAYSRTWETGKTVFRNAIRQNNTNWFAENSLGAAFFKEGAFDSALVHFDRAIGIQENYGLALYNRGLTKYRLKMYDGAEVDLNRVGCLVKEREADAAHLLGKIALTRGDSVKSERLFRKAWGADSTLWGLNVDLAGLYTQKEDYPRAFMHLRRAMVLEPGNIRAYDMLAGLHKKLGATGVAAEIYLEAARIAPETWQLYNNLGLCYLEVGNLAEALNWFSIAVERTGARSAVPWLNRARVFHAMGNYEKAHEDLSRANSIDSGSVPRSFWTLLESGTPHRESGS